MYLLSMHLSLMHMSSSVCSKYWAKSMEDKNFDRTVNTRNVTPPEVAYRDGYVQGKTAANDPLQYENQRNRESDSAANGFLTGAVITAVVGAGLAMYFFVYQAQRVPVKTVAPKVEKETKVIEKTTDTVREIMPSPIAVPPAPTNVEITLPNPVAAPAQPPASTQPAQPAQAPSAAAQPAQPSAQSTQPTPSQQ